MARSLRRHPASPQLRVAEQQDFVWGDGLACREIGKAPLCSDLVALENPRIALDRLHERAGFALFGSAALAETAAVQPYPELIDRLGRSRKIVHGMVVGVQGQIGLNALEARDNAGE